MLRLGPGALLLLLLFGFGPLFVIAGIVNRTIDDTFGDSQTGLGVAYLPTTAGVWKDELCVDCAIKPDTSQTFKGTYTAATYAPSLNRISITMKFNGTAIYVFFVLANNQGDGITTLTLANFTLDGNGPQLFQHAPDLTTTSFDFNQLVFSQTNLINAEHTLVISTSGVNTNVYVNFDYAIYTHDDDAPLLPLPPPGSSSSSSSNPSSTYSSSLKTSASASQTKGSTPTPSPNVSTGQNDNSPPEEKKSTSTGAIAGGVIGGLAALTILATLIFCYIRRQRQDQHASRLEANGYTPPLMEELGSPIGTQNRSSGSVQPFTDPYNSRSRSELSPLQAHTSTAVLSQASASIAHTHTHPLSSFSHSDSPYDGYASPIASGAIQGQRGSDTTPSSSGLPYASGSNNNRRMLHLVTAPDPPTSPGTPLPGAITSTSSMRNSGNIEDIRRARQNELDQRLRTVQEEMAFLASDITGEKGSQRRSVKRRRTVGQQEQGPEQGAGVVEVEEEMSMAEMKDQLRFLREQIEYLREQQRSAWAQGLSDDPPPGYTPASA